MRAVQILRKNGKTQTRIAKTLTHGIGQPQRSDTAFLSVA